VAINVGAAENPEQVRAFSNACRSISTVVDVAQSQSFPGGSASGRSVSRPDNLKESFPVGTNSADQNIINVLNIKLLAGSAATLVAPEPGDTMVKVVVNELVAKFLGHTPESAIGKRAINLFGYDRAEIVGVMDNFHFQDLHEPVRGYIFHNASTEPKNYSLIRLNTKDLSKSMQQIGKIFEQMLPTSAFDYIFLDEHLDSLYRREQRTASVVLVFSCLSILIACLGLFGLAAFTAEQRTKEIGVRKVLGATVNSIVGLLSRDFLRLVLVSVLIASPLAWYFMNNWLKEFAYRINIEWWVFAAAGLLALLIAFVTVSLQSLRAATVNPVKSLRSE
jgi:putative ABC transport system permease protein